MLAAGMVGGRVAATLAPSRLGAAVANAAFRATGKRIRELPTPINQLITG